MCATAVPKQPEILLRLLRALTEGPSHFQGALLNAGVISSQPDMLTLVLLQLTVKKLQYGQLLRL